MEVADGNAEAPVHRRGEAPPRHAHEGSSRLQISSETKAEESVGTAVAELVHEHAASGETVGPPELVQPVPSAVAAVLRGIFTSTRAALLSSILQRLRSHRAVKAVTTDQQQPPDS